MKRLIFILLLLPLYLHAQHNDSLNYYLQNDFLCMFKGETETEYQDSIEYSKRADSLYPPRWIEFDRSEFSSYIEICEYKTHKEIIDEVLKNHEKYNVLTDSIRLIYDPMTTIRLLLKRMENMEEEHESIESDEYKTNEHLLNLINSYLVNDRKFLQTLIK